ncbi:hypothetical protein [Amycolatopsis taiwanensis]|uniref:Uncharacterized protein n=1 Tax=Amycolatopsis taiwanensis TaxID=342230 RepID=A0A9W6R0R5_9PSEU|nr:hypothetical protein [Amycolatopsis taiwanensis]GLY66315.1 hypothetical protein Atai01_29340 [Amycolatopsis taiwanensis]
MRSTAALDGAVFRDMAPPGTLGRVVAEKPVAKGIEVRVLSRRAAPDRVPLFYYKAKLATERIVEESGLDGLQVRTARDLTRSYLRSVGRRPVVPVRMPGRTGRGYREGGNLVPENGAGKITFEEFLSGQEPCR